MVIDDSSRGQLILIAALTLAFILLGLVMLFNGVLFTETISTSETKSGASQAAVVERSLSDGIGGIAEREYDPTGVSEAAISNIVREYVAIHYAGTIEQGQPGTVTLSNVDTTAFPDEVAPTSVEVTIEYSYENPSVSHENEITVSAP